MSDYLSNLAARTLGLTEGIHPRLPSLFEPSPATVRSGSEPPPWLGPDARSAEPIPTEPVREPTSAAGPRGELFGDAVQPVPRRPTEARARHAGGVAAGLAPTGGLATDLPGDAPDGARPETSREQVIGPGLPDVGLRAEAGPRSGPTILRPNEFLPAVGARTTTVVPQTPVPRPFVPPSSPASTARPEPGPAVRVTIGRVEVRAISPPASPLRQPRAAPPKPSLEEYLRSRRRGRS